jgi:amino acid transporter
VGVEVACGQEAMAVPPGGAELAHDPLREGSSDMAQEKEQPATTARTAAPGEHGVRLKANAIGLIAVATLGIVFMGPATSLYGTIGPVTTISGGPTAFLFLLGGVIVLPTAICYANISRRIPSAGSAYTWLGRLINKHTGNWLGWMMYPYYILVITTPSIIFGLFFNAFLQDLGVHVSLTNYWTYALAVVFCYALSAILAGLGITTSTRAATIVVSFECLVILALALTIVIRNAGHLTLAPLNPGAGTLNYTGFWIALPISFALYTGFDVISTAGEETRLPRRSIPRATILSVILYGIFMAFAAYGLVFAVPLKKLAAYSISGITPVIPIAKDYWGAAHILVNITGLTAGLGATLAIMVGTSRIMFAMGRDRALPRQIGRLHERFQTPWLAIGIILVIGVPFDLIAGKLMGALNAYFWAGTAITWFALILYMSVCVGSFILAYKDRANFRWRQAIIPAVGIIFIVAVLYKSFLQALWQVGWVTIGRGIVVFALVWTASAFVYAYIVRNKALTPRLEAEIPLEPRAAALDAHREDL